MSDNRPRRGHYPSFEDAERDKREAKRRVIEEKRQMAEELANQRKIAERLKRSTAEKFGPDAVADDSETDDSGL